ncbi:MAG: glucose 1-dehydrogenase [Clostridia bacterium]|nr:glucose 1-dehydrogenase [Clostridia bacterium]
MKLENKVAIVTGAGSGMGKAIAELFVKEGAKVVAADINDAGVNELISSLGDKSGNIVFYKADVSDRSQVEGMIDFAVEKFGSLNILVNNAGILDKMMPVTELEDGLWNKVREVNVNSIMYACRKAIPIMEKNGGGSIINTASVGGLNGCRAGAAYTASKFAAVGLTKNIGYMYAKRGIRCNAICPGSIMTNIGASLNGASEFGMQISGAGVPLSPRMGQPEEIATAALFLASDDASFVNGATINVDGGWTAY